MRQHNSPRVALFLQATRVHGSKTSQEATGIRPDAEDSNQLYDYPEQTFEQSENL